MLKNKLRLKGIDLYSSPNSGDVWIFLNKECISLDMKFSYMYVSKHMLNKNNSFFLGYIL